MISFIIPAYNEEGVIQSTIVAVMEVGRAIGGSFEVLVVDDNSSDQTGKIAEQCGARVVHVTHRQIAATRNTGAKEAKGDLFVFVDADTLVNEAVVRDAVEAIRGGAIGGGCLFKFDGKVPWLARLTVGLTMLVGRWKTLCGGCFMFVTRKAFEELGGFDEKMYAGEELGLCQGLKRLGTFVLLKRYVTTSGRKVRTYSSLELMWFVIRLLFKGTGMVADRRGLDFWYGTRREDLG